MNKEKLKKANELSERIDKLEKELKEARIEFNNL